MHLFTYGTLQFPEVWYAVTQRCDDCQAAIVTDYAIYRVEDRLYPAMVPESGGSVIGRVYFDLDASVLRRLDQFEGNEYLRQPIEAVLDNHEKVVCDTYLASPSAHLTEELWDREEFQQSDGIEIFLSRSQRFS